MGEPRTGQKTETIGYLSYDELEKLKGWAKYEEKSDQLSQLRKEIEVLKAAVREELKRSLRENGEIDFVDDGDGVRVFRVLQPKGRKTRRVELTLYHLEVPSEQDTSDEPDLDLDSYNLSESRRRPLLEAAIKRGATVTAGGKKWVKGKLVKE